VVPAKVLIGPLMNTMNNTTPTNNNNGGDSQTPVSTIQALDIKGSTETTQTIESTRQNVVSQQPVGNSTTLFVDDAGVVQKDTSMMDYVSDNFLRLNDSQETEQSIRDFLAKPIAFYSDSFATTDTLSTFIIQNVPYALFNASEADPWKTKLRGFFGIRCTFNFKLVVNANRFQQGRYSMGFIPSAGAIGGLTVKDAQWTYMHNYSLVQRTTTNHVEVDLATDTSAELVVPFTYVSNFYPLQRSIGTLANEKNSIGHLTIWPYSPLVSPAGSTTCGYTIYCHLTDVSLYGAASPQSGLASEVANKNNGMISGPAFAFSRAFSELKDIPLLSSMATSAEWITDRIGSVARIFGWSKPTAGDSIPKMQVVNNPGHSTVDGDSDVRPLGASIKNSVIPLKGIAGTKYDEMDFAFWFSKYAWFKTVTWTTAHARGTQFVDAGVGPYNQYTLGGYINHQPLSFICSMFQQWRGSIKYKFKIVKTEFHSGRLSVCYWPGDETGTNRNLQYSNYVNRTIIDIRNTTEFEITIPFVCRDPWSIYDYTGNISIYVIEPLVAPSTVSSSVSILCEVCGGDDFEVAIPETFAFNTVMPGVPQSGIDPKYFAEPQSGIDTEITKQLGNTVVKSDPIIFSAISVGEKITSFRALLKRYNPVVPNSRIVASTAKLDSTVISIVPDFLPIIANTPPTYHINSDILTNIAVCYAIWGGGIRIKDVISRTLLTGNTSTNISTSRMVTVNVQNYPTAGTTVDAMFTAASAVGTPGGATVYQDMAVNNTITVEMPQYTSTLKRAVQDLIGTQATVPSDYSKMYTNSSTQKILTVSAPQVLTTPAATAAYDVHNIFRAMADDGNLSCFISIPPIVAATNTYTNGIY
jgi:hypothetical protein